jgi:hypothetical protein
MAAWLLLILIALAAGFVIALVAVGIKLLLEKRKR